MPAVQAPWWQSYACVGSATVLHVDLAPAPEREWAALTCLDEGELLRWSRFEYSGPRRQFVLSRAALRAVLCRELACGNDELAFGVSAHGKPFARVRDRPADISFSVSHGGWHGLIAFAPDGRLGVDIEERVERRRLDVLIDAALGTEERAEVASAQGPDRLQHFFKLWTMKEALQKADGRGIKLDATTFEIPRAVRHGEAGGTLELPQAPGVAWHVRDLGEERFAAAIAHDTVVGARP
ncbi:MAG: 4'-phosphopantetheinyl transferase superfamily protein [Rhodospirillales bacterium]|nr:4'-phosphopantetheinyl transferase superfamily protein [Rhodospirillales bacterium]